MKWKRAHGRYGDHAIINPPYSIARNYVNGVAIFTLYEARDLLKVSPSPQYLKGVVTTRLRLHRIELGVNRPEEDEDLPM